MASTPSTRSNLTSSLLSAGRKSVAVKKDDKLNEASEAFAELLAEVESGSRPMSELDRVIVIVNGIGGEPTSDMDTTPAPTAPGGGSSTDNSFVLSDDEKALIEQVRKSGTRPKLTAIARILADDHPQHIKVDGQGTPKAVAELTQQVTDLEAELEKERDENEADSLANRLKVKTTELDNERDPNKSGSLKQQLEQAQANATVAPTGTVRKDEVKAKVDEATAALANVSSRRTSTQVDGTREVYGPLNELAQLVQSTS